MEEIQLSEQAIKKMQYFTIFSLSWRKKRRKKEGRAYSDTVNQSKSLTRFKGGGLFTLRMVTFLMHTNQLFKEY